MWPSIARANEQLDPVDKDSQDLSDLDSEDSDSIHHGSTDVEEYLLAIMAVGQKRTMPINAGDQTTK